MLGVWWWVRLTSLHSSLPILISLFSCLTPQDTTLMTNENINCLVLVFSFLIGLSICWGLISQEVKPHELQLHA